MNYEYILVPSLPTFPSWRFSAWQRLEPDSRSSDVSIGIQGAIHDPAWMLSRQWALGEFEGEDCASVVYTKVSENHDTIRKVRIGDRVYDYDPNIPLEVYIERTKLETTTNELDFQMRMKLGLQFFKEMEAALIDTNILDRDELNGFKNYLAGENGYIFELNEHQNEFEPDITREFLSVVKYRVIDIYKIFNIENVVEELNEKVEDYFNGSRNDVSTALETAFTNLINWWNGNGSEEPFFEKPQDEISAWDPRKLEYDFKIQIGPDDNKLICNAEGYREDHLSWYSFTIDESDEGFSLPANPSGIHVVIPRQLTFAGQPEKRFWNFEDSYVNFGEIKPKITDILTLLLMEFAFVHSADWYAIPLTMNIGTLSQITNLTLVDTFGDEIQIVAAGHTRIEQNLLNNDQSWDSWNAFTLARKFQDGSRRNTRYLFLPPVISDFTLSPNHEEVKFLRDEVANLTWAIEKKYKTLYGESISGYDHYLYRKKILEPNMSTQGNPQSSDVDTIKFTFMTSIPWNWIPFIPVHEAKFSNTAFPDHKQIVYQRGRMINPSTGDVISPNSRLLNEVPSPYFVDESVIPRSGIFFSERYQRTIWFNGRSFLWIGRKKAVGTGEGYSGLKFDKILFQ